jgi:hypothetical protein
VNKYAETIEREIVDAAQERYGARAVRVLRVVDRFPGGFPGAGREPVDWFWLSVDGELVARRRTKSELLELIHQSPNRNQIGPKQP